MSVFNQMKMAQDMMKNMSPEQIKELMEQAKDQKKMLDEQIRQIVDEEIKKRDLISRQDAANLLKNN